MGSGFSMPVGCEMDRDTAIKVHDLLQQGGKSLTDSIPVLRGQLTDDAFHQYCLAIGTIVASIQFDVLRPYVYEEHPDLAPKPPSVPEDLATIERLKGRFKAAADRARNDES
jgi:hypothetical protein